MDTTYPMSMRTLLIAIVLGVILLGAWEYQVRREGNIPSIENDKHIWAQMRQSVESATPEDVVIIGSSRVFFDLQLKAWEAETGRKPIQLAIEGSSPTPVFKDIAENSDFAGTLIVGVTPGLFFSPPSEEFPMYRRPAGNVRHYYKRTYAEKLGHFLSFPLQHTFAFLRTNEQPFYNDLDLTTVVSSRIPLPQRVPDHPPFPSFGLVDKDRNMRMMERTVTDTAFANMVKRVWGFYGKGAPPPEKVAAIKPVIIGMATEYVNKIKARGGKVIFVRCPSSGPFLQGENALAPKAFWEELLQATGCPGYHFEDHEFMSKYELPEWSHLSGPDADTFTRDFVQQLKKDGLL